MAISDEIKRLILNKHGEIHHFHFKKLKSEYVLLYNKILNETSFLDYINPTIKQRIWYILNNIKEVVMCKNCGNTPANFRDRGLVQEEFCSRKCINSFHLSGKKHYAFKNKTIKHEATLEYIKIHGYDKIEGLEWKINPSNEKLILIKCQYCGDWYTPKTYDFKNKRNVFCCNKECKKAHPNFSINGKDGTTTPHLWKGKGEWAWYDTYSPKISFCEETKREIETGALLVRCVHCKEWFRPSFIQVLQRLNGLEKGTNYFYCSDDCRHSCPIFKRKKYVYGMEPYNEHNVQKELKALVFERDDHTCQICGKNREDLNGVDLCCHHIDPIKNNPIESADIDNCISVCRTCHNMIHTNNCNYGFLSKCKQQW